MYLAITPMAPPKDFTRFKRRTSGPRIRAYNAPLQMRPDRRRLRRRLIPSAKRRPWWQKFFSDDDGESWSEWGGEEEEEEEDAGGEATEEDKFEAWKRRAEAITELREAEDDARTAEGRDWEDWIGGSSSWETQEQPRNDEGEGEMAEQGGFVAAIRKLIVRQDNDDMLFEDRVFQYASTNSAKFIALLVLIPWAFDFLVHDYLLMPFLDRYVKLVPLASEMLDVRKKQKLEMIKTLKVEKARFRLEVEIGKSPPLSDEEVWLELRHKAIELRDEWRLENRREFANIWSDGVWNYLVHSYLLQ